MIGLKNGIAGVIAASLAATAANASDFSTLGDVAAVPMSASELKQVEGKVHIYRLVEFRGVDLNTQAEAATRVAAPTPKGGDFTRSPSREATAFDFLN